MNRILTPGSGRLNAVWATLLLCALTAYTSPAAYCDTATDKKRALMAGVKRVAIVTPFFGTETQRKTSPTQDAAADKNSPAQAARDERLAAYTAQLQKLVDHDTKQLPDRVAARTPFQIVAPEEMARALKALDLTPESLFDQGSLIKGRHYPTPNPAAIRRLAEKLQVDAVLLSVLDEPRRINGHYIFNPFSGLDYNSSHVEALGGFFVVMANGTEALHDYVSVLHPLTHIGNRSFLLIDWEEAHDLMIEDLLDEWTRYTPPKH